MNGASSEGGGGGASGGTQSGAPIHLPKGPLHRLSPGPKLGGLIVFAVLGLALRGRLLGELGGLIATAAFVATGVAFALLAGMRAQDILRVARRFAVIAVLLFAFQTWQSGWHQAVEVVGGLFALVLAASAFTASTAVADLLDTITRALGPLRRFGVRPERVALAFSLVITSIPTLFGIAHETRAAAQARGLDRSPRALLVPFALRTVAHAQLAGEALAARGLGDD